MKKSRDYTFEEFFDGLDELSSKKTKEELIKDLIDANKKIHDLEEQIISSSWEILEMQNTIKGFQEVNQELETEVAQSLYKKEMKKLNKLLKG